MKIEKNSVKAEGELTDKGDYTVEYDFEAVNNKAGKVTGTFTVNSKEEVSGDKVTASSKDLSSVKDEKVDELEPTPLKSLGEVEKPKEPKPVKVEVENIVISTEKPVVEDVKTTAHKTTVTKETPKETPKVEKQLPKTGAENSTVLTMLGAFIASLTAFSIKKRKEQ